MSKSNGKTAILVRVDKPTKDKLKARARRERRSLSSCVELILIQQAALEKV